MALDDEIDNIRTAAVAIATTELPNHTESGDDHTNGTSQHARSFASWVMLESRVGTLDWLRYPDRPDTQAYVFDAGADVVVVARIKKP